MKEKIKASNIWHSYQGQQVLTGLNAEIEAKKFVSIMGESGSGKSTLLSILAGSLKPERGSVFYDDKDISRFSDYALSNFRKTEIGYVYQFFNLIPTLKAKDNILLPVYLKKANIKDYKEKFLEISEILKIDACLDKYPDKLSGGEQQRIAIARSIIYEPDVLVLDEPTGNLDSKNTLAIMELIKELNRLKNITVVQVTHSRKVAEYSDQILTLSDGVISVEK
jgi:putative ABC transport system ATP-binding protein